MPSLSPRPAAAGIDTGFGLVPAGSDE